jgi:hypothetical protein
MVVGSGCGSSSTTKDGKDAGQDVVADLQEDTGGDAVLDNGGGEGKPDPDAVTDVLTDGDSTADPETQGELPGEIQGEIPVNPDGFRFVVFSDPRVDGGNSMGANDLLAAFVEIINARNDVDFVLVMGDLAMRMINPWAGWQGDPGTYEEGLGAFVEIMNGLDIPWYAVPGDRDYVVETMLGDINTTTFADFGDRHAFLKATLGGSYPGDAPWFALNHKGASLFVANTMAGPLGYTGNGQSGSLGLDQLNALSAATAGTTPSIVFGHHSPQLSLEEPGVDGFLKRISTSPGTLMALFHGHRFQFGKYAIEGLDVYALGGTAQGPEMYALVEVDPVAKTVTVLNEASLPFKPPMPTDAPDACEPGQGAVGGLDGFVGSSHAVFFKDFASNDPFLNDLLSELQLGDSDNMLPFGIRVLQQLDGSRYKMAIAEAGMYKQYTSSRPVAGYHSVDVHGGACQQSEFAFNEPCMSASGTVSYDPLIRFSPTAPHAFCNVDFKITVPMHVDVEVGPDSDGNLSFPSALATVVLHKPDVVALLESFLVQSYCFNPCNLWGDIVDLVTGEGCNPEENGHKEACGYRTLTFAEVPPQCDAKLGSVPVRTILYFADLLPFEEATVAAWGYGHKMTITEDMSIDWSMSPYVFHYSCLE